LGQTPIVELSCTRFDQFQIGQAQIAKSVGTNTDCESVIWRAETMVSGHRACHFEIGTDIFSTKHKSAKCTPRRAAFGQFSQLSFSKSVRIFFQQIWNWSRFGPKVPISNWYFGLFLTNLKSVTFGATPPNRLRIGHPQIVSYFFNRFQIGQGVWGGQISKLHGMTDFKLVRSAN